MTSLAKQGFKVAGLLVLALVVPGAHCSASPVGGEDSGIQGQVLRSPVQPGPQMEGQPSQEPFSAIFHVLDALENEVVQFESDEEGRFRVLLVRGKYTIVPDASAPILNPVRQRRDVTVPDGEIVEVTLRFDTGLR